MKKSPERFYTLPLDASKADPAAADEFAASTGLDFDYNAPMENAPMEPVQNPTIFGEKVKGGFSLKSMYNFPPYAPYYL